MTRGRPMDDGRDDTKASGSDHGRRRRRWRARRRLLLVIVLTVVAALLALVMVVLGCGGDGADDGGASATASAGLKTAAPPKVWVASASDPVRVWVGGDSMGGELGLALEPLLRASRVFEPTTFYRESTGICRYDFYDWGEQIRSLMKTSRPQAAVIMIGANDTQSVWRDGDWIPYGGAAWKRAYEERVGDIIDAMLRGGARRVYWVGMPIMGDDWRNSRMRVINAVFRRQAELRPGGRYVDIWELYAAAGEFDPSLRLGDGVHFTVEGQQLLATTVYEAIERDWLPPGSRTPGPSPPATPSASASPI